MEYLNGIALPVVPSPHDDRDFKLTLGSTFPQDDFNLGDGPILDQKNTSQCGNFSFKSLMDPYFSNPLSPSYAYANRFDKGEYQGEGVMARDILKDVYHDGLCHIDMMPTHGTVEELKAAFSALPQEVHDNAALHKIESYYRLSKRPDNFLDTMRKTGLQTLLAIPLYKNAWIKAQKTGIVFPPEEGDTMIGGHMVKCSGQTEGYIRIPNTWGEDYPINGVQLIHKDYPIWEAWMPVPNVPTRISMNQDSSTYFVNGEKKLMDTMPVTRMNRVHVPLRFFMESMLGTFVDWDQSTKTAHVYRGGTELLFRQGADNFFSVYGLSTTKYEEGVTNYINEDDRMLIPLRPVAEFFGWNVKYDHATRNITIDNY